MERLHTHPPQLRDRDREECLVVITPVYAGAVRDVAERRIVDAIRAKPAGVDMWIELLSTSDRYEPLDTAGETEEDPENPTEIPPEFIPSGHHFLGGLPSEDTDTGPDQQGRPQLLAIIEDVEAESLRGAPLARVFERLVDEGMNVTRAEYELAELIARGEIDEPYEGYVRTT